MQVEGYLVEVLAAGGEELEDRRAYHDADLYTICHINMIINLVREKGQLKYHEHGEDETQVVGHGVHILSGSLLRAGIGLEGGRPQEHEGVHGSFEERLPHA